MTRTRNAPLPTVPGKATCQTCRFRQCPDRAEGKQCPRWVLTPSFICPAHGYWVTSDHCCRYGDARECRGCEMPDVIKAMRLKPLDWKAITEIKETPD